MTLDFPFLKRLAPSMKRAAIISAAAFIVTLLILFMGVRPMRIAIRASSEEVQTLNARVTQMRNDIANAAKQDQATDQAAAERMALVASGVVDPLLGSFAMRGKTLLDPIAQQTGFHIDSVRELPPLALQLPNTVPQQRHNRQPVEFTGQGSYTQITAFITQTEASLPMATLSGLLILSQPQAPETHKAIITFEWPVKGEKVKPEDPSKKK